MKANRPATKTAAEVFILLALVGIFLFLRFGPLNQPSEKQTENTVKAEQQQTENSTSADTETEKKSHPMTKENLIGKTFYHNDESYQFVDDHRLITDSPDMQTTVLEYSIKGNTIVMKDGSSGGTATETIHFLPNGFKLGNTTYTLKED